MQSSYVKWWSLKKQFISHFYSSPFSSMLCVRDISFYMVLISFLIFRLSGGLSQWEAPARDQRVGWDRRMYSTDSFGVIKQFGTSLPKAVVGWLSSPASACYVEAYSGLLAPSSLMCFDAQSCLTLYNFMNFSPPGFSIHGDSPGKNTAVGSMPFSRDLPKPGTEPRSPTLKVGSLLSEPPGKPLWVSFILPTHL